MYRIVSIVLLLSVQLSAMAGRLDSLKNELKKKPDNPEILNALARTFLESGQADSTWLYSQRALKAATEKGDELQQGHAYYNMSDFYYFQDSFPMVFKYGKLSLKHYKAAGNKEEIAKVYNDFGLVNMQLGRLDSGLVYFKKTLPIVKELGHAEGTFATINGIAQIYLKKADYVSAILEYRKLLEMADSVEFPPNFVSSAHTNLGVALKKNGNLEQAIKHYKMALKIDTAAGLKMDASVDLSNIGGVLFSLRKYDEALEYFNRSLKLLENTNFHSHREVVLNNIASVYKNTGQYEKALSYYQEALDIARTLGTQIKVGIKYLNIGSVNYLTKNYDQALNYYEKARPIFETSGSNYELANTYLHMAQAWQGKNSFRKAEKQGLKAFLLADSIQAVELLKQSSLLLSEVNYSTGNLDEAMKYRILFDNFKDTLFDKETNRLVSEMDARFNLSEQAHKIDLLKKDQLLKEKSLQQQRQTIIMLAIGAILLTVLLLIIWIQYREKKRSYASLVKKNKELIAAEKEARKKELNRIESKKDDAITGEESILANLYKLLDEQKIYLESKITQKEVAEILETNTAYLSKIVNKHFNMSFNNVINKYRVRETQELLASHQATIVTIEAISKQSGFHSKSAFQAAFKKFTGVTPSVYLKQIREEKKKP